MPNHLLLLLACSSPPSPPAPPAAQPPAAPPPASAPTPADVALTRAEAAAKRLGSTLKARVVEEMGKGGPVSTVQVCNVEAPAIAATIQTETGVSLGRSSLRLRNPNNAPPAWVQDWLVAAGEGPAAGKVPLATVVEGKARVIKPIVVEAPCLACHGDPATLAPDVKEQLATLYPADRATGYAVGDLRGALWAEAPAQP